jgi:MATE family multidrug resistance protein
MLLGLADTMMIGHVGTVELAASAFVNTLFFFGFALIIGLSSAVSISISRAYGAARYDLVASTLRHGLVVSLVLGIFLAFVYILLSGRMEWFQQAPEVTAQSGSYLRWLALSFIPLVPMMALKSFSEALQHPWAVLWLMLGTVLLNVFLNYLLIFGNWGFPTMGLNGAGCATFLARGIGLCAILFYLKRSKRMRTHLPERWRTPLEWPVVRNLVHLGAPISLQVSFEFAVFVAVALLIGQFGSVALAAHQIAFTCASTTFMLPLGLSMALTIRVGHAIGADEWARCRRMIFGAFFISVGLMSLSAIAFVGFGTEIAAEFTKDLEVIRLASAFLVVTAVFQVFDGVQVVSVAALQGMRDVYVPAWISFGNFFLLAIPLGIYLAFFADFEAIGLWYGMATGLCVSAVVLSLRLSFQLRRQPAQKTRSR